MKKTLLLACAIVFTMATFAQEQQYKWAFGLYTDVQLKSPDYYTNVGMQAKYDLDNHSAFQVQVFGRSNFVGIGADYLFSFFNKAKSDFNIFLGPGVEQNFTWYRDDKGILEPNTSANFFNATGQLGASYNFRPVRLSVFTGLKAKYNFKEDLFDANYIMLGLQYHLW